MKVKVKVFVQVLTDWKQFFPEELSERFAELGLKSYRAAQLFQWMHQKGIKQLEEATNLSQVDVAVLAKEGLFSHFKLVEEQVSARDGTTKYLFALSDGAEIETVMIPAAGRETLCVSSQVGCGFACTFCATGLMGHQRNLAAHEIVEQFYEVRRRGHEVSNVVFMGMGEPLANYQEVTRAIRLLNHPEGAQLGARRFTISTVGLAPKIRELAQEKIQVNLAISLNAPTNKLRNQLMPINLKYPVEALLAHAREYAILTHRRVSFEYVLLADVNDGLTEAKQLARLVSGLLCHVNLIPYNPVVGLPFARPLPAQVTAFYRVLKEAGIPVSVRESGGSDIQAACGQLRARGGQVATGS